MTEKAAPRDVWAGAQLYVTQDQFLALIARVDTVDVRLSVTARAVDDLTDRVAHVEGAQLPSDG